MKNSLNSLKKSQTTTRSQRRSSFSVRPNLGSISLREVWKVISISQAGSLLKLVVSMATRSNTKEMKSTDYLKCPYLQLLAWSWQCKQRARKSSCQTSFWRLMLLHVVLMSKISILSSITICQIVSKTMSIGSAELEELVPKVSHTHSSPEKRLILLQNWSKSCQRPNRRSPKSCLTSRRIRTVWTLKVSTESGEKPTTTKTIWANLMAGLSSLKTSPPLVDLLKIIMEDKGLVIKTAEASTNTSSQDRIGNSCPKETWSTTTSQTREALTTIPTLVEVPMWHPRGHTTTVTRSPPTSRISETSCSALTQIHHVNQIIGTATLIVLIELEYISLCILMLYMILC